MIKVASYGVPQLFTKINLNHKIYYLIDNNILQRRISLAINILISIYEQILNNFMHAIAIGVD